MFFNLFKNIARSEKNDSSKILCKIRSYSKEKPLFGVVRMILNRSFFYSFNHFSER